eukprot:4682824-Prymnesium_polylepis.2
MPVSWENLSPEEQAKIWTPECSAAFRATKDQIGEDCMVSHPDLRDPYAQFGRPDDRCVGLRGGSCAIPMAKGRPKC